MFVGAVDAVVALLVCVAFALRLKVNVRVRQKDDADDVE